VRRWFAVRRFERGPDNVRVHTHTFANLIHADFRIPSTDYADLLKVTRILTRNHQDVLRAFRRMVFNVAAHTGTTTPRTSPSR
jgi:serine/threonine-protein kinase HipA